MDWRTFITISHIFGTVLGVGATTFAEIFYIKFLKDGEINPFEHNTLKVFYQIIRLGLVILVFSGFGYLILWRLNMLGPQVFFSVRSLSKLTVILVLLATAFAMNFKLVNLKIGSAITLVSWYAAMVLGIWRRVPYSYWTVIIAYMAVIVVTYFVLEYLRSRVRAKRQ